MPRLQEQDLSAMVDAIALLEKELARYGGTLQELVSNGSVLVYVSDQSRIQRLTAALSYYAHATEVIRDQATPITLHRTGVISNGIELRISISNRMVH